MRDYAKAEYATLSPLQRFWLHVLIAYHEWQAENSTRLIARIQDEINRGISEVGELAYYKAERLHHCNRRNELRARLGLLK